MLILLYITKYKNYNRYIMRLLNLKQNIFITYKNFKDEKFRYDRKI